MIQYKIQIKRGVAKQLARVDTIPRQRIEVAIAALAGQPRPAGARALTVAGGYRIRIGDYRVIYAVEDAIRVVSIVKVGHRRDIYRRA